MQYICGARTKSGFDCTREVLEKGPCWQHAEAYESLTVAEAKTMMNGSSRIIPTYEVTAFKCPHCGELTEL
jgi:hypothetical protein